MAYIISEYCKLISLLSLSFDDGRIVVMFGGVEDEWLLSSLGWMVRWWWWWSDSSTMVCVCVKSQKITTAKTKNDDCRMERRTGIPSLFPTEYMTRQARSMWFVVAMVAMGPHFLGRIGWQSSTRPVVDPEMLRSCRGVPDTPVMGQHPTSNMQHCNWRHQTAHTHEHRFDNNHDDDDDYDTHLTLQVNTVRQHLCVTQSSSSSSNLHPLGYRNHPDSDGSQSK